ncbi:hypothetical protein AVEN_200288-1 [Araneus ventricosus]|uniref:Uncharacterized protein n=1 Tax=Araneus ventricosus TaxID=182803 RepID=A0A4Y2HHY9_ARAVE|nr:hypothetical protein AVEN_200288-1 [Araneus ventricosus]
MHLFYLDFQNCDFSKGFNPLSGSVSLSAIRKAVVPKTLICFKCALLRDRTCSKRAVQSLPPPSQAIHGPVEDLTGNPFIQLETCPLALAAFQRAPLLCDKLTLQVFEMGSWDPFLHIARVQQHQIIKYTRLEARSHLFSCFEYLIRVNIIGSCIKLMF